MLHEKLIRQYLISEAAKETYKSTQYSGPADLLICKGTFFSKKNNSHKEFKQVYKKHCYKVSHKTANKNVDLRYAEGYVWDSGKYDGTVFDYKNYHFIRHGWLIDKENRVIDKTYKPTYGEAIYYGVHVPTQLINYLTSISGYYGVFWGKNRSWPKIEKTFHAAGII